MPGVRCNEHVLHPISTGFGYDIDLSLTFFPHTARTTGRGEIFVPLKRANGDPQFEMLDLVVSHTASTEQATAGLGSIVHDRQTICKDLVTGVKDTLGEGGVTYLTVEGHSSRLTASNNQHLGLPLHPESISQLFERQLARVGVPRIRFHDLRHTNATVGLAAGVPTKIMSARLGHATTAFTQDVYMKSTDPLERDAATRIAGAVRQGRPEWAEFLRRLDLAWSSASDRLAGPASCQLIGPSPDVVRIGKLRGERYWGLSTQNSLSSGSAMTTQLTSPWPISTRVAPRELRRATSARRSPPTGGAMSRWSRFLPALGMMAVRSM